MRIIHISDIHACTAPDNFSAFFDKRIVGLFNYLFRRRFQHKLSYLEKCVDYILENPPDVVVCTGDLSSTSQPAEFEIVRNILKPLSELKDMKFLCVPGNHDVYVNNSDCLDALHRTMLSLNSGEISDCDMPAVVKSGNVEFMLCNESRPTNIFLSTGKMDSATVEFAEKWVSEDKEGTLKIIIGHFPLKYKYGTGGFRHCLYGHKRVCRLLEEKKIALSLCGHIHTGYMIVDDNGYGEVCAGSLTRYGRMMEILIDESSGIFTHKVLEL